MKKILFTCCALGALTVGAQAADLRPRAPALVAPVPVSDVSGYVGLNAGWGTLSAEETDSDSFGVFGGEGRVNWNFAPGLSTQFDIEGEGTSGLDNIGDGDSRVFGAVGAHLSWRNPGSLLGAFGGVAYSNNLYDYTDFSSWFGGVEGQAYFGPLTLYGQLGYSASINGEDAFDHVWFARAVARYFLTPNTKLQAEVGYADGAWAYEGDPAHIWTWGLGVEHRLTGPLSLTLDYVGYDSRNPTDDYWHTGHQVTAGVKLYFGGKTLLENDRTGATLDLPKIFRPLTASGWNY
jgi:opacity protein-like surface antigen